MYLSVKKGFQLYTLVALSYFLIPQAVWAKQEPLTLEPSSNWVSDYADDSCRLIRRFGKDDDLVVAIFNRFGPGDSFQLTLAGEPVKMRSMTRPMSLQFGPTEKEQKIGFSLGTLGKTPALIFGKHIRIAPGTEAEEKEIDEQSLMGAYNLQLISAERNAAVTNLSVGLPLSKPVVLALGPMDQPLAALSKCIDELMTHWGIDVEKHKMLTRTAQPESNPGNWVKSNDYPREMLDKRQPALVQFRLSVDKTGEATACHIQQTTRPKEFDDAVCNSLMRRSKFLPALDKDGNPISSYYRNAVRFMIAQ